jgi:hypothetical protein
VNHAVQKVEAGPNLLTILASFSDGFLGLEVRQTGLEAVDYFRGLRGGEEGIDDTFPDNLMENEASLGSVVRVQNMLGPNDLLQQRLSVIGLARGCKSCAHLISLELVVDS